MTRISWFAIALALAVAAVAIGRLLERRSRRRNKFEVDDEAIDHVLRHGTLTTGDDEPLDEDEIARAEDEFWEESWDEPEEYGR